jgi:hypothetical protein
MLSCGDLVVPLAGGIPPEPSANAAEASDNSKSTTPKIRFVVFLLELLSYGGSAGAPRRVVYPGGPA